MKAAVTEAINNLLEPIREKWKNDLEFQYLTKQAYPEVEKIVKKKESKKHNQAPSINDGKPIDVSRLDIRVAKIIKAELHQSNPKSYVSTVDVGDASGNPRTVVSGLASYIPLEQMQGRFVLAICNLKPSKFQGIESSAMLLAASSSDDKTIELLDPPAGSETGEKIFFEGYGSAERNGEILNPKNKIFEKVAENFKINEEGVATFKDIPFKTSKGDVTVKTLKEGIIR